MNKIRIAQFLLILGFVLGVKDGFIALWKDGASEPRVFPYRAQFLPEKDCSRLAQGIYIEDESQLNQLLEDYLS